MCTSQYQEQEVNAVIDSRKIIRYSIVGGYIVLFLSLPCSIWLIVYIASLYQDLTSINDLHTIEAINVYRELTHFYTGVIVMICVCAFVIYPSLLIIVGCSSELNKGHL
jgi:hypothetical protein